MTAIDFAELPSATPSSPTRAQLRIDPFWAALWSQGAQASWVSAEVARAQEEAGLATVPSYLAVDPESAWERLGGNGRGQARRFKALAAIDTWRTVTGEQLAHIAGEPDLARADSGTAGDLFATGLADVGIFTNALVHTRGAQRGTLYRPSRTPVFERQLGPRLTYAERVAITGGLPWESGSQFDRHNILAVELALRVAEWCEIGAVVGEKLSKWNLLAHEGAGFPRAVGIQNAADATLIRTDGARIAVEITASTNEYFEAKVRRWAELLSNRRMADTGLVVVFVVAPRWDKRVRPREVSTIVRKLVAAACRDFPGVDFDRVAERMFVAEWTDWFPAAGQADSSFLTLTAQRPSGGVDDRWQTASLLDPIDVPFSPRDEEAALAVLDNLGYVGAVPHWLRRRPPRELWPLAVKELGFTGIPVPPPSRPETYKGKPLGAAFGVSGQTLPPRRLRAGR